MRRTGLENLWLFRKYRETCCPKQFRDHVGANRIVENKTQRLGLMRLCKETCCTVMSKNSKIFQIIFN